MSQESMESGFGMDNFKVVAHNVKPAGSDKAELSLAPTANKFTINAVAAELMGVMHGDTITIIENDSDNLGAHYAITKGFGSDKAKLAAAGERKDIFTTLGFSWAGPWGKMLLGEPNAIAMSMEVLAERGVVTGRETIPTTGEEPSGKIAYSANQKLTFTLKELGTIMLEGMEEAQPIFGLVDPTYADVTPRTRKTSMEGDTDATFGAEQL